MNFGQVCRTYELDPKAGQAFLLICDEFWNLVENEVMWATRADEVEPENADEARQNQSEPMACVQIEALVAWLCGAFVPRTGLVSKTMPSRTERPQIRGF